MVQRGVDPGSSFLQKPFSLNVLGRKVRELLENPPAPQEEPLAAARNQDEP